jgi:hypothetical protein
LGTYAICKLISFILETTKDSAIPSRVVLLVGAFCRTANLFGLLQRELRDVSA